VTVTPFVTAGQVVGLLGGSFDPPHDGHVRITTVALQRFGIDRVWWLVSPGNPLKVHGPAPMAERMATARALIVDPRVSVTDLEARIGTRHTAQTLRWLRRHKPGVKFVWLMGADNLAQFHRWQDWEAIMEMVPVGVLARPGARIAAQTGKAARVFAGDRLPPSQARRLGRAAPPAWCFVNMPMVALSSSAIRASGGWGG
jgi:nicotinate-nucleotide adenylyltransferase